MSYLILPAGSGIGGDYVEGDEWTPTHGTRTRNNFEDHQGRISALEAAVPWKNDGAQVATSETTSSTSYADLATSGPSVTVTLAGSKVTIGMSSQMSRAGTGNSGFISVDVSGANTIAASDANGATVSSYAGNFALNPHRVLTLTGLAAGSTTFKMRYRCDGGGPWTYSNRSIIIAYQ